MSELLEALFARDAITSLDLELSRALAARSGERNEAVLLAVALTSQAVQEGHVCLDLAARAHTPWLDAQGDTLATLPPLESWLSALRDSPLVQHGSSAGNEPRPLVLDGDHRLYLARYHDHECRVAEHLTRLASTPLSGPPPDPELVQRLFPAPAHAVDLQRDAALASCTRRLSVIVGGPGTGKTSTVVKLLALLVHGAVRSGQPAPRVLLTAPTGKAAQRLSEAIAGARDRLPLEPEVSAHIGSEALTVHRALGSIAGSSTRFRHGPHEPLDCDVLLLDEASMVDLALMRRLLDAVPAHARVIMLGDPDQLASVEAGGVLSDVCAAQATGQGPLASAVSRLTESYRYAAHSGIAALARAIHAGDAEAALDVLRSGREDVRFAPTLPMPRLGRTLEAEVRAHYKSFGAKELTDKLRTLDEYRVLCAHRKGELGVEHLNQQIARVLRGQRVRSHENYAGRPVLITQNDYASSLFNGDVGVLHADRRNAALVACFRTGPESVRRVALGRLPSHESVYAMTVHKSQGSEFERVALVLPDPTSPVLTRELLYTAITRAKSALSVYGSEAALRAAIARRALRSSGLTLRLTHPASRAP